MFIRGRDHKQVFKMNSLQPVVDGKSVTGLNATPRNIGSGKQITFVGYLLHNNDAATRWVQIFFKPNSQVTLGVTAPDMTVMVAASGSIAWDFLDPVRSGNGFSAACTTTETGSTGPTAALTGSLFFVE